MDLQAAGRVFAWALSTDRHWLSNPGFALLFKARRTARRAVALSFIIASDGFLAIPGLRDWFWRLQSVSASMRKVRGTNRRWISKQSSSRPRSNGGLRCRLNPSGTWSISLFLRHVTGSFIHRGKNWELRIPEIMPRRIPMPPIGGIVENGWPNLAARARRCASISAMARRFQKMGSFFGNWRCFLAPPRHLLSGRLRESLRAELRGAHTLQFPEGPIERIN